MEIEITRTCAELMAELMRLVVLANLRWQRRRIYALHYDNATWIQLMRRRWAFDGWEYIMPQDTRATEEYLRAAIEVMREEISLSTKEKTA